MFDVNVCLTRALALHPFSYSPPLMNRDAIATLFDHQASSYDAQWERMSPVRDGLYFLMEAALANVPANAHLLSVGAGTGLELAHLAQRFPHWRFTAVDPSRAMLDECRQRAERLGHAARCTFHHGFLDTLDTATQFDGATCLLVSHFLTEREARVALFRDIAARLRPGATLVNADLAADVNSPAFDTLLALWMNRMSSAGVPPEALARARAAYSTDVAVVHPQQVEAIIASGGFDAPTQFFQAGLMHAWLAQRHG
jgi:tRNA (cmo5U34)-methyltransferase